MSRFMKHTNSFATQASALLHRPLGENLWMLSPAWSFPLPSYTPTRLVYLDPKASPAMHQKHYDLDQICTFYLPKLRTLKLHWILCDQHSTGKGILLGIKMVMHKETLHRCICMEGGKVKRMGLLRDPNLLLLLYSPGGRSWLQCNISIRALPKDL